MDFPLSLFNQIEASFDENLSKWVDFQENGFECGIGGYWRNPRNTGFCLGSVNGGTLFTVFSPIATENESPGTL